MASLEEWGFAVTGEIQSVKKRINLPVCRLLYNKLCFFVYF